MLNRRVAVIVAHPDDEMLWCGGFLLANSSWHWTVVTLCRESDTDRKPKFFRVMSMLRAEGFMGDLDDGPEQRPLPLGNVKQTLRELLPDVGFDLVLTHGPAGEYTRHRRHEECCRAVVSLWAEGGLSTRELWLFAYEDGSRAYLPRVRENADFRYPLTPSIRREKLQIITDLYGFSPESWEARASPSEEGFWQFHNAELARQFVSQWSVTP